MTAVQFNHILDMEAAAGASTAASGETAGAPATSPASLNAGGDRSTTPANDNEAPVIHINGNNPATVSVGDIYADLGAVITSPQADQNLGIHTFVDGIATDAVIVDTSTPGNHSIDYVVTGISGLTSTSTRTVVVSVPQPANDNLPFPVLSATGTDATSTAQ